MKTIYILIAISVLIFIIIFSCCFSKCIRNKRKQKEDIESLIIEQQYLSRERRQQEYLNERFRHFQPSPPPPPPPKLYKINNYNIPPPQPLKPQTQTQPINDDEIHKLMEDEIKMLKKNKKYHQIDATKDKFNQQIFDLNNKNRDKYTIDLHGLHVNNAIIILTNHVNILIGENYKGKITVISGKGNHSKNGKPLIKPEVIKYFNTNRFEFTEISNGGAFSVKIN